MANKQIELLEKEIEKINNKESKVYFFVYDTKGAPNGSLAYIYEIAFQLKEMGYDVRMLQADKDFVGVESWLGEKYSNLPHFNIEKDITSVSASDVLIIPEIATSVMSKTKDLPCKRVVLIQNLSYLTDTIPMGASFSDLKINECITTSNRMADKIQKLFPYMRTSVIRPSIPDYFYTRKDEPRKPIVYIVSNDTKAVDSIIKPFYWKYPIYYLENQKPFQAVRDNALKLPVLWLRNQLLSFWMKLQVHLMPRPNMKLSRQFVTEVSPVL